MSAPRCVLLTDDYLPHLGGSRIYYHMVAGLISDTLAVVTREAEGAAEFDRSLTYPLRRVPLRTGRTRGPSAVTETLDAWKLAGAGRSAFGTPRCLLAGEMIPSAAAAFLASRKAGIPYGIFVHDEPLSGAGRLEKSVRLALLRKAGAIIASSSFPARRARECTGNAVPLFLAPPGVDFDRFSPGEPEAGLLVSFGISRQRFLLSVGRLVNYKNVDLLVRTIAQTRDIGLKLVVVGEGPDRNRLEQEARDRGVAENVVFAGRVPDEQLCGLYRGALAYVFPSRRSAGLQHEGIGMAALEAAAAGCAVIASAETSAGDFVKDGETGFLFDPEDGKALESFVRRLNDRPDERARLAGSAVLKVRREYTWRATSQAVLKAIEHLLSGPR